MHLLISNGFTSSKTYDKRNDFDFEIIKFFLPFLVGDVSRAPSYGNNVSQPIRFARVSSLSADLNARNKILTAKLRQQGYRYHKLRKVFSKCYRQYNQLISKYETGLKHLVQGLPEPEFHGDLVHKFRKIVGIPEFSDHFSKLHMLSTKGV